MIFLVALGGALGATARYLVTLAVTAPLGTLCVNVLGSLLIGVASVLAAQNAAALWPPFVITGCLGGFTTFSAFSLDSFKLIEAGQPATALAYMGGTLALCLIGVLAGVALARGIWA